jgi:hypothetical protein
MTPQSLKLSAPLHRGAPSLRRGGTFSDNTTHVLTTTTTKRKGALTAGTKRVPPVDFFTGKI